MNTNQQALIVVDLGYGDCGKGTMVDFLTRETGAHTIVRFNGGSQAAHNVITPDGRHHTFAQFGSGTLVPESRTHLSRFMLIDPMNMLAEERHLQTLGVTDAFQRTSIDVRSPIISPFQKAMNKLRELARGEGRHGSCGLGIGETMSDLLAYPDQVVNAGDLASPAILRRKLSFIRERKREELRGLRKNLTEDGQTQEQLRTFDDPEIIDACIDIYTHFASQTKIVGGEFLGELLEGGTVIFEAAQGVLLDEWYGFHPFTTWSTTTVANAETLLQEAEYKGQVTKLGVLRAYFTRHGPGPFVTENPSLNGTLKDLYNGTGQWQREFRVGPFDLVAARYALSVCRQVDCLAITHLDQMEQLDEWQLCRSYQFGGRDLDLPKYFETVGEEIQAIKVAEIADLEHQEKLTNRLLECIPQYAAHPQDKQQYLDTLAEELGTPVAIVSTGPKATDKFYQPSAEIWFGKEGRGS